MRQPERQTAMEQKGGLERAQEQSRGIIEQAQIGADARLGQAENMIDIMRRMGGRVPSRVSIGGNSVSFSEPDEAPNSAYAALEKARTEYEFALKNKPGRFLGIPGTTNPFGGPDNTGPRKAVLDQAIQGYLGQLDPNIYHPTLKTKAWQIYNNPELDPDMSSDETITLLQEVAPDLMAMDENGLNTVLEMLRAMRGK